MTKTIVVAACKGGSGKTTLAAAIATHVASLGPQVLMSSFAFILGVVPLMIAEVAGAELRQAIGTAVFFGMLGVTFFGLIFTPVFYVVVRTLVKPRTAAHLVEAT